MEKIIDELQKISGRECECEISGIHFRKGKANGHRKSVCERCSLLQEVIDSSTYYKNKKFNELKRIYDRDTKK